MRKLKILTVLGIALTMSASLFTGCSTNGLALVNAFQKSQTITSERTYSNISINISAANMSQQEKDSLDSVIHLINKSKISAVSNTKNSADKKTSNAQADVNVQLGGLPVNVSLWANEDLTGTTPVTNVIVKVPEIAASSLPTQFQGKDYMVMNSADINSTSGSTQVDYAKAAAFNQEFQTKLTAFMSKYIDQFNPAGNYIGKTTSSYYDGSKNQNESIYELSLNDASFKSLLHYTLTNLSSNTDAVNLIKDYLTGMSSIYGITDTISLDAITNNIPQELTALNNQLSSIDNLKILGDKGIKIRYIVNADGYIVKEQGTAQFVIDMPAISKLAGGTAAASTLSSYTGIYTITLNFDSDITNINGNVFIASPKVDSTNSFNYTDLLKASSGTSALGTFSKK